MSLVPTFFRNINRSSSDPRVYQYHQSSITRSFILKGLQDHHKYLTMKCGVLLFCTLIIQLTLAKPGDYGTYGGGEYGGGSVGGVGIEYGGGGAYQNLQESPVAGLVATTDLKPASTFDIGYGSPEPSFPSFRSYGGGWGGWKQPQHIIAPIQVIAKPIHVPILPFGWGWQNPGIF